VNSSSRLLSLPVLHAVVIAVISMFKPHGVLVNACLWAIWVPFLFVFYGPEQLVVVFVGAFPFLLFAATR